jgi:hypothetical protein
MALTGAEMRACWAAPDPLPDDPPSRGSGLPMMSVRGSAEEIAGRRPRTFVPVDEGESHVVAGRASATGAASMTTDPATAGDQAARRARAALGWSLWGDVDP